LRLQSAFVLFVSCLKCPSRRAHPLVTPADLVDLQFQHASSALVLRSRSTPGSASCLTVYWFVASVRQPSEFLRQQHTYTRIALIIALLVSQVLITLFCSEHPKPCTFSIHRCSTVSCCHCHQCRRKLFGVTTSKYPIHWHPTARIALLKRFARATSRSVDPKPSLTALAIIVRQTVHYKVLHHHHCPQFP